MNITLGDRAPGLWPAIDVRDAANASSEHRAAPGTRTLVTLLGVAIVLRLLASAIVPLIPEEAYYWVYAQHPQLSYFDHPPMVAWVIWLGTAIFGDTEIGVRFVGQMLMLAASWVMYRFARTWFDRRVALTAAVMLQVLPAYFLVGMLAPMDAALCFFWLSGLLGLSMALRQNRTAGWYLAGATLGAMMLTKYSAVFFVMGTVVALLISSRWRRHLVSVHPYLAMVLAIMMFSPVIVWNMHNSWASFDFQFVKRYARDVINAESPLMFLLFQFLILTPVFCVALVMLIARTIRKRGHRLPEPYLFAAAMCVPAMAVVALKSLRSEIHINWALPIYLAAIPAMCAMLIARDRLNRQRDTAVAPAMAWTTAICLGISIVALIYLMVIQPRTGWLRAFGPWRSLAVAVEVIEDVAEAQTHREPLIVGDGKYQLASILAFYRTPLESHPAEPDEAVQYTTSQWVLGRSGLGYPFWAREHGWDGNIVVFVTDNENYRKNIESWFDSVEEIRDPRLEVCRRYHVAVCRNLRPDAAREALLPQAHATH